MVDISMRVTEQTNCPVCDSPGKYVLTNTDHELDPPYVIRVYDCPNCHTVFHNPRMSHNSMIEYYRTGTYRGYKDRAIDVDRAMERVNHTVDLIDKFTYMKPGRSLDVGSSRGFLSKALHDRYGVETVAHDVYQDPEAVWPIVSSKDQIAGKFHLITCIHVLEHLHDPMAELTWMSDMLDDGGILMLELPFTRKVMIPHPVIFSRESIPLLMKHINAVYVLMDAVQYDTGIIFAKKIGSDNGFSLAIRPDV